MATADKSPGSAIPALYSECGEMVQGVQIVDGHILSSDPASGALIGRVKVSSAQEVDSAVATAAAAQPRWEAVPMSERVSILKAALQHLRADEQLATLITREMGKVLSEAQAEVDGACDKDAFLELVRAANEPVRVPGGSVIYRDAHGVVALCTPWNFPVDELLMLALPVCLDLI
jgi:succinylglutamic semialdehyde dehydrogenase